MTAPLPRPRRAARVRPRQHPTPKQTLQRAWDAMETETHVAFLMLVLTAMERQALRQWLANEALEEDGVWP